MMLHAYSGNVVLGVGGSQTTLGSLYLSEGIDTGMYKKYAFIEFFVEEDILK